MNQRVGLTNYYISYILIFKHSFIKGYYFYYVVASKIFINFDCCQIFILYFIYEIFCTLAYILYNNRHHKVRKQMIVYSVHEPFRYEASEFSSLILVSFLIHILCHDAYIIIKHQSHKLQNKFRRHFVEIIFHFVSCFKF